MMVSNDSAKPEDISIFGGQGLVLTTDDLTHPFNGLSCVHSF
jgi:hypothetical protein